VAPLERDHFDLLLNTLAVRNVVRYTPRLRAPAGEARDDWRILLDLAVGVGRRRAPVGWPAFGRALGLRAITPSRLIALGLRTGPYKLSLGQLARHGRTVDLGPLQPGRLAALGVRGRLAPPPMLADLARVEAWLASGERRDDATDDALSLVGRRQLRDNNSWLYNSPHLMQGADRCVLQMHPADAHRRGLRDGQQVLIRSRVGQIAAPLQLTTALRPGVVSFPHGYGHGRAGTRLRVAEAAPGVCINSITTDTEIDELSGTSSWNGLQVTVTAAEPPRTLPNAALGTPDAT
jgi:anaerobic selenocysteine-containing dehydrogenase